MSVRLLARRGAAVHGTPRGVRVCVCQRGVGDWIKTVVLLSLAASIREA